MCYRLPDRFRNYNLSRERAIYRFDPVPGTGVKNWKFGNFYKTANCAQERRLHGDPDHRKYNRGKRYPSNLPNAWDDYPKSRIWGYKSWKRTKKKKQWMKKGDNNMSFPNFTPLGAESTVDEIKESDATQREKSDYNVKYGTDNEYDGKEIAPPEEDYEVTDDQKNPERNFGKPGIRLYHDEEHEVVEKLDDDEMPPEDGTPVVVDDAKKHGSKNKYRLGGEEGKRGPSYESEIS